MTRALTSNEKVAYVAEAAWGTTPASALKLTRMTSVGSKQDKTTVESGEILPSRSIKDLIETMKRGGVSLGFELSYGVVDDFLEGLVGGAWATNVLKVSNVRKSFTIERQFTDIGQFLAYTGAVPTKLDLNIALGQIIGGSWEFASKFPAQDTATVGTGSATAAPSGAIMDPISSVQLIQEGGSGAVAGVTEASISITNGVIDFEQLASADPAELGLGEIRASGKIGLHFADATYFTKFADHTTTSIAVTLGGASAAKYAILFNSVKLKAFDAPNQGKNNKLIQMFEWEAIDDSVESLMKVTRTA